MGLDATRFGNRGKRIGRRKNNSLHIAGRGFHRPGHVCTPDPLRRRRCSPRSPPPTQSRRRHGYSLEARAQTVDGLRRRLVRGDAGL
uniref:Uncharacterized protein n=1 Tax=Oryza sativa subsp. japonica TaxID=39947 RepID=Q6Z7G0_ORYSJ|nr:hypothetical protein [Oryza sativa Japonica Group]BAD15808.1 hypothetical protein [Oryza sativa Japonica Group]